jgi:cysteine desulfurase / selenocysteine lyase
MPHTPGLSPLSSHTYDVDALRAREFPWTQDGDHIYLNNAGTGPLPQRTVDTLHEWTEARTQPWRITDHEVVFPALARTRAQCARLIGADAAEIALVPNTSAGLNLAARALPFEPGDVVLTFEREFPSLVYAFRAAAESREITLRLLPAIEQGWPDEEALIAALDEPRVRAVVVSWVAFATGYRLDLARIGAACRARGIFFIVDAMQGLGPATLDVEACAIDILACGGFKWLLAPWGSAFAYVRRALIERLPPPAAGWLVGPRGEDYTRLLDYDLTYYDDARRFEVMTLASQDFAAFGRSLDLLHELGPQAVEAHVRTLTDRIVDWARDRAHMRLVTPADPARRAGIVSIAPPDAVAASQRLRAAGVLHSLREGSIRFAPYAYNTVADVDAALARLDK